MLTLTLIVFFVSGFAALLYQVAWQRMLAIFSGADVYSATIIVSAYMVGLGIGSLVGGQVADRMTARGSLALFAVAELAIAAFGAFSTTLYYDVLYQRFGHVDWPPAAMAGLLLGSLFWPTFFMGASLPLLARAMTHRLDRAARSIGTLYGVNTLGAATGALISTWVLLPSLGLEGSVFVGAMLNVGCAAFLVPIALRFHAEGPPRASSDGAPAIASIPDGVASPADPMLWRWAVIYACSGFLALSLEIVWFRLLGVMTKSNAFTFGSLLALYLAGLGIGSLFGSRLASRVRRPAPAFLAIQGAVGLSSAGLLLLLVLAARRISALRDYFSSEGWLNLGDTLRALRAQLAAVFDGNFEPAPLVSQLILLYLVLPALLVIPPTFLMGLSFPVLQRVVHTDLARVGRRVGTLLLANVLGSMAGAMLTGWVLLDLLGTAGAFKLLAAIGGTFGLLALLSSARRHTEPSELSLTVHSGLRLRAAEIGVLLLVVGALAATPGQGALWAAVHGTEPADMFLGEDGSGVAVLKTRQKGHDGKVMVFVNGLSHSSMPYGSKPFEIHTVLGALPALIHPDPRDVAVIGLGSGDTTYAIAGRTSIERVTCIEIIRPQLDTLQAFNHGRPYAGLSRLLSDPRIEHVFGDGRAHLLRSGRLYDIIEADALPPRSAYAGNLYSEEYFALLRSRLKPGGLAVTWVPTPRAHASFLKVFPYVMSVPNILLGSGQPIVFDREAVTARLSDSRVRNYYQVAGIEIQTLLQPYLEAPVVMYDSADDRAALTDTNTDLFPKDEYDLGSIFEKARRR